MKAIQVLNDDAVRNNCPVCAADLLLPSNLIYLYLYLYLFLLLDHR